MPKPSFALATQRRVIRFFCVSLLRRRPFVAPHPPTPLAWRGLLGRVQFTRHAAYQPCGTRRDFLFAFLFSPLRTGFHLFCQLFCVLACLFHSVVAAPDSHTAGDAPRTVFNARNLKSYREKKRGIERRKPLFLSHLGSRFPSPSHPPHPAGGPRQTHCPHCGQDAEGDARARPKKQAGGIRPIRRSFPCSAAFNESESEIAISSFGVTAAVPTPTCAPRERKRHRPRSLATRKRETSRPMTFCGWRNRAKDFLRSRWLAARGESCVACGVTRGVVLLLTRCGRAHVVLGGCILSLCQQHLSWERRRQPTHAEASARDQNLVRRKFSRRWDRYSAVEMCFSPSVA